MKRITGLFIVGIVFAAIFAAIALTGSVFIALLVFIIALFSAAIIIIGVSLAAGEDAFAAFRDLLDY